MSGVWTGLLLVALTASPGALTGTISLKAKDGTTKRDASEVVVYVADLNEPVAGVKAAIRQQTRQFVPRVLTVAAGTEVDFPNEDNEEHNVFSHSAAADFDLGRFAGGRGKSRVFSEPGVIEIFCNVHKEMLAYLVVAPSPKLATTGPDGTFEIKGIPPGVHRLAIWERFARPRLRELRVEIRSGATTRLDLEVTEQIDTEPAHKNKQGVEYPAGYH
jgi:plastocyanin